MEAVGNTRFVFRECFWEHFMMVFLWGEGIWACSASKSLSKPAHFDTVSNI